MMTDGKCEVELDDRSVLYCLKEFSVFHVHSMLIFNV